MEISTRNTTNMQSYVDYRNFMNQLNIKRSEVPKNYTRPKISIMPLSQKSNLLNSVIDAETVVNYIDKLENYLAQNTNKTQKEKEDIGSEVSLEWDALIKKALRDHRVPMSDINEFNSRVKAMIKSFIAGLPINVKTGKKMKEEANKQSEILFDLMEKLNKMKDNSTSFAQLANINDKILMITKKLALLNQSDFPIEEQTFNNLVDSVNSVFTAQSINGQVVVAQQQQQTRQINNQVIYDKMVEKFRSAIDLYNSLIDPVDDVERTDGITRYKGLRDLILGEIDEINNMFLAYQNEKNINDMIPIGDKINNMLSNIQELELMIQGNNNQNLITEGAEKVKASVQEIQGDVEGDVARLVSVQDGEEIDRQKKTAKEIAEQNKRVIDAFGLIGVKNINNMSVDDFWKNIILPVISVDTGKKKMRIVNKKKTEVPIIGSSVVLKEGEDVDLSGPIGDLRRSIVNSIKNTGNIPFFNGTTSNVTGVPEILQKIREYIASKSSEGAPPAFSGEGKRGRKIKGGLTSASFHFEGDKLPMETDGKLKLKNSLKRYEKLNDSRNFETIKF